MKKHEVLDIVNKYLSIHPNEKEIQSDLLSYLERTNDEGLTDWNNFDGHLVSSVFVYAKDTKKFLAVFHIDFNMFLCPGGHLEPEDINPLTSAIREVKEETGITDLKIINNGYEDIIPFEIQKHDVPYNKRFDLPEHNHYDFRYLMEVEHEQEIILDADELSEYKWIKLEEFSHCEKLKKTYEKIHKIMDK